MYYELNKIEPSTSCVILWMCLDYFNLKDSTDPSASPQTSIQVKLIDSFDKDTIQGDMPQCFDERTKYIKVYIAETNWDSSTENLTLNKFLTMAYYHGYLTMIGGMYLAILNREMLEFWTWLLTNKAGSSGEPPLVRDSRSLTESLVSRDLDRFCEGLERHFLDYLVKVNVGSCEYYYHEILLMQIRLGIDPLQYDCHAEVSTASGKADICLIPRAKGGTGILIEVKRTDKEGVIDGARSSSSTDAGPGLLTDASAAATATTDSKSKSKSKSKGKSKGKSRGKSSVVDITRQPYSSLKGCLREGIEQIEENKYLQPFNDKCSRVLAIVPAFCGRKYLVTFKCYEYDGSDWVPSADQPSAKHKFYLPLPVVMAPAKRSNEYNSTGEHSNKET
ncbi:hypothetical protein EV182_004235 [Spiromyces aspiralis]|uniref:Uncharacterized protein n=1 Tax=Spiromyces aspiralis TaxID=68401 RepID=A0ACC1HQ48_9FUNG|nr:hypothetical protein EV182_004235 [Spiromyces aspiralis]